MTLITDGLPAYHDAYKKEFWTHKIETRTEHIRHITLRGDHNNNKMERFNGEIRDREKNHERTQNQRHINSHWLSDLSQLHQKP